MSLEKYIKIVERVNIDDPGSYKTPVPVKDLGDGFQTVDHNGQKGVRDTQTGKLILISNQMPNVFNIVNVQDGKEVTEYGLSFNELGPATQKALRQIGVGGVQETYESSEQVRSIVQRMMEDARVPQKPRQGPLRPQTGAGKHKDKKKDQKQGKEKHKKPFIEQGVAEGSTSKEKQKTPYRDINSPEYKAAADKQKEKMAKDKAAEPGKKLLSKIEKKGVAEGDDWLNMSKREFKRREMEHELGHEVEPRREKPRGMYFYNVPSMDLFKAKSMGLKQSRSGKWYSTRPNPQADLEFGKGKYWEPKETRDPSGGEGYFEAIQRDLKLPNSYYLQLSSGAKSDLKNLYINYILESVSGVKKDTLETVSYPELKNIVRMIEEKQKGVDGKACWKGYKRMGTKKKGRRTVDNCVKAESLQEKSPPGFKGTVKAMKKHPELTKGKTKDGKEKNPWALAWHMKNKGYKSHKKADGSDKD